MFKNMVSPLADGCAQSISYKIKVHCMHFVRADDTVLLDPKLHMILILEKAKPSNIFRVIFLVADLCHIQAYFYERCNNNSYRLKMK